MVAEWVRVISRSYRKDAQAAAWFCTGADTFSVEPAEKAERGTDVIIKLKDDAKEFLQEARLREIVRKHSDFVPFPIFIGQQEEQANRQTALWRQSPREVEKKDYEDFYKQLTLDFEPPLAYAHMVVDAPVQMYALLFVPASPERSLFSLRKEDGLKLYARKVLIQEYNRDLLPEYLSFVQGVVDSEDLPLNVSRETVQSVGLMPKLKKVVAGQVTKELEALARNDAEKYNTFWQEFGAYLKQGVAANPMGEESIHPLLRFKTNLKPETWSSLEEYAGRMKPDQKVIYYIVGDDPKSVLRSPHLDYFHAQGMEALLLTDPLDSFMLMGLRKYKDFELQNVAQAELPEQPRAESEAERMPEADFASLVERFKQTLGERVTDVRTSARLSQSVARLVDPEGAPNPELQRVYKYLGKEIGRAHV